MVKQEDTVIIAIHLLGKLLGFSSERAWHRFVTGNLTCLRYFHSSNILKQ
ncbi:Mobile element protein [Anoxybacillus flavithermus]|uniref:Mobile element protein n=1 Tax=Anoxybacillus flavithermus TaxID=33934 RepID=A0A178TGQ2_9BACL|nr:Mobile element protein [Anoxybacillus flavithermus]OAO83369.1 Mobile element protein [Anoxybacillus flavithermus]